MKRAETNLQLQIHFLCLLASKMTKTVWNTGKFIEQERGKLLYHTENNDATGSRLFDLKRDPLTNQ